MSTFIKAFLGAGVILFAFGLFYGICGTLLAGTNIIGQSMTNAELAILLVPSIGGLALMTIAGVTASVRFIIKG